MTTPSTERKAGPLLGTGAQTTWPFTFKVFAATDIAVTVANSLGVETQLVYGVDYNVTLNANQETSPGGTVTYPITGSPLPAGSRLVIVGNLPYDQPLDLPAGGNFSPLALENQLDRATMQIQQLRERLGRALQLPVTTTGVINVSLPKPSANQLIGWDGSGSNLQNVPLSDIATALAFATYRFDTFTGDGVETQFTLSADPAVIGNLDVAVGGVTQTPGVDYTLVSGVLVFSSAPPLGVTILARYGEALPPGFSVGANDVAYSPAGVDGVPSTVENKLRTLFTLSDYTTPEGAVNQAFADQGMLFIRSGETAKLVCDPTNGDDIQAMAEWISSGHYVEEGGELYIEIADGLHNVSTYIDITNGRFLDIRATATPTLISITGATFSNDGEVGAPAGEVYTATISLGSALPSRVVPGYAVGGLNVQGDGGADALNCGMIVDTIALDRLSFTAKIRSHGVVLTNFTTPDGTATLGLTPNQLVVPFCCIRANEAGWDGAAREGFINALRGARIHLWYVGITYNGVAGDNDILFARDAGSEIALRDYCVIAGAGEMILRSFNQANIDTNRSCLGGSTMGINVWQGSAGGTLSLTRTMFGSVSGDAISASLGAAVAIGNCVGTGANQLLRTTYAESAISATSTRLSRAASGVTPTKGEITVDSNSSIRNCTTPITLTGSNSGTVHGNPTISDNTNAAPTPLSLATTGGVWIQTTGKVFDPTFYKVGRFSGVLDFPSISANSFADLTVTATGAAFDDFCLVQRAGAAEPSQGIVFRAFVSAADTVTVRAYNITTGAIDPTSFTCRLLVIRAT